MLRFEKEQKTFEIGNVKIGGQPGELPTVLISSIFWLVQKMVQDVKKGVFNAKETEDIINKMQSLSDLTGVPFLFDVVGTTTEAFQKYLDFIADHSESLFLMDAMSPKVRMETAAYIKQGGLRNRTVYNTVYKDCSKVELEKVKESGITASIVLADNPRDNSLEGKLNILEETLALAKEAGIEKSLIDTAIPAFAPDMGTAVRAIHYIKDKLGYPTGLGTGNIVTTMERIKANVANEFRKGCVTATNAIIHMMGANWLMFGPAEQSDWVFPAVAIVDTYVASAMADLNIRPSNEDHPIFKVFL
jgi:tetrahydromethanopterin S-methyltransferase subunit H